MSQNDPSWPAMPSVSGVGPASSGTWPGDLGTFGIGWLATGSHADSWPLLESIDGGSKPSDCDSAALGQKRDCLERAPRAGLSGSLESSRESKD